MVTVRPIRLTRFHTTTSPGYSEPLSETTAQEFHLVAQCDQWPCCSMQCNSISSSKPTSNPLQLLFIHMVNVRPIRLTRFHTTTSPGYWGPLSETTAQEFHPVAQCDQWPLLFHAVQQHILFQTHIKPSTTFVHSHGQCATHQINEIPYNNVTRVLRTPQWNHSTRVSSRRTGPDGSAHPTSEDLAATRRHRAPRPKGTEAHSCAMWPQQMASTVYINHGTKSILIPWMEEILHHLIRGFSWFIPLFIGFQHVSTIPGAGFFHPAWRCQATSVLSSTGSIDSCARGESRGSVGPSAGSACGIRVHLPAVSRGFCGSHWVGQGLSHWALC